MFCFWKSFIFSHAFFVDLSHACDWADYGFLVEKICSAGLDQQHIKWFYSCISGTTQTVVSKGFTPPADVPQGYSPGPLLFTYKLQPSSYRQFFFYTLEKEIRRWTTKLGAQVYVRPLKVLIYIRNYDVIMVPSSHIQEPNVLFISTKLPSIHFLPLILGYFQVTGVYKCTCHQETLDCRSIL